LISTLPLQTLGNLVELPDDVRASLDGLLYNSIHIVMVHADRAAFDDRFAYYIPDQETLFHRVCRLNFLGEAYSPKPSGVVLQAEVTFRPGSHLSQMPPEEVERRTVADLGRLGLVALGEVRAVKVFTFPFAYVIYDLLHRQNVDRVLAHLRSQGILCLGRFGEFEYLNTDQVAERAQRLARELDGEGAPSKEVGQS
jgi:protoporphyrinogen oxidase